MSQRRWGWLLLVLFAFSLMAGWTPHPGHQLLETWSVPIVFACPVFIWLFALVSPPALRWHPAAGAWFCWIVWAGVSCLSSKDVGGGLETWIWAATAVLLFMLAHAWWGGAHRRAWVAALWLIVPLAIYLWPRAQTACLLSLAAASCWGMWISASADAPVWRWEIAVAGISALVYVFIYGTWGSRFGFFFAAVLCSIHSGREKRWMTPALLLGSVVAWLFLFKLGKIPPMGLWWRILMEHPVTGAGIGSLKPTGSSPAYILRLAAETGWVGMALFIIAAVKSMPQNFKSLGWEGRAAAAAVYALFAESLVDGIAGSRAFDMLFFSAIACASNWARAQEDAVSRFTEERHGWSKPAWASALGLLVCIGAIGLQRAKATAMSAANSPLPATRTAGLERLVEMEPLNPGFKVELAKQLLAADPRRLGGPLSKLDEAILIDPLNPQLLDLKAELFAMAEDWDRSGKWSQKALESEPEFAEARLVLAESLLNRDDPKEAFQQLGEAKRIHDKYAAERSILSLWDQNRYDRVAAALKHAPR